MPVTKASRLCLGLNMVDIQSPEQFTDRLQLTGGEGFLSPGERDEVSEIITGLDLQGTTILDIGVGAGGPTISLICDHHAD